MAVSEALTGIGADVIASEPVSVPSTRSRIRGRAFLVPLLPIGIALMLAGAQWRSIADPLQWLLGFVGAVAFFYGFEATGVLLRGPGFDAGVWLAGIWMALIVLSAIFADLLPLSEARNPSKSLTAPILERPDLFSEHPFGTDRQGLDILGGVIYGARISLQVSLGAVAMGLVMGGVIGVVAAYYRGKIDFVAGFLADSVLAFPPLILLLAVVAAVDASARNIALALAVLTVPTLTRLARANTFAVAQREFVLAAKAMGATNRRIIFRELVPNVLRPLLSYAFLIIAGLIVAEASLSFLGVGIRRPTPTWGNMIAAGQETFEDHPHLVFMPGMVMFTTVFAINKLGDRARRIWDNDGRGR